LLESKSLERKGRKRRGSRGKHQKARKRERGDDPYE